MLLRPLKFEFSIRGVRCAGRQSFKTLANGYKGVATETSTGTELRPRCELFQVAEQSLAAALDAPILFEGNSGAA
jgi:hypothetical protein